MRKLAYALGVTAGALTLPGSAWTQEATGYHYDARGRLVRSPGPPAPSNNHPPARTIPGPTTRHVLPPPTPADARNALAYGHVTRQLIITACDTEDRAGPGSTPLRISAATTVSAPAAKCIIDALPNRVVVLAAVHDSRRLPGARDVAWANLGRPEDSNQARFVAMLSQITNGDHQRPLLIYSNSDNRALSSVVVRRAVAAGYPLVFWMPSGIDGWSRARFAFETVPAPSDIAPTSSRPPTALPQPILRLTSIEAASANGRNFVRYRFDVLNKDLYPAAMFTAAPNLPPCGTNTNSSRSWVDFFSSQHVRIYGFCALGSPQQLGLIWFALPEGQPPPSHVYIEITDRQTNQKYRSNLVATTL